MRVVHLPILLVLAGSAAVAAPSDQKEFLDIATRFARTTTNDPAYNGVLAAYCQRVRARIEGLPGNDDHRVVDRGAFGPSAFALGGTCARVGHGWWPENYEETHVLDDGPFWSVRTEAGALLCGRGVAVQLNPNGTRKSALLVGLTREELDEAAAGRGLRARHWTEPEFPPLSGESRAPDQPFQYDIWIPRRSFRSGQPIPVYSVLRSRRDSPQGIRGWRSIYETQLGPCGIDGVKGPDGNDALDLGVYRVLDGKRTHVPIDPRFLNAQFDNFWEPRVLFPPRGAMVYAILLHPAYDVAAPGEYEIWAHYWGGLVDPSNDPDMFRGQIPATPVPFRVLPSWRAMLTVCAAVALPAAGLLALGWRALRRRARAA